MLDSENNDNKYPIGMFIYAKAHPELKLIIETYRKRIYYCEVSGHRELKQLAYFERELINPREGT